MKKGGWVYIMANRYRGGMYVGVTADVLRRVDQHRDGKGSTQFWISTKRGLFMWNGIRKSYRQSPAKNW